MLHQFDSEEKHSFMCLLLPVFWSKPQKSCGFRWPTRWNKTADR